MASWRILSTCQCLRDFLLRWKRAWELKASSLRLSRNGHVESKSVLNIWVAVFRQGPAAPDDGGRRGRAAIDDSAEGCRGLAVGAQLTVRPQPLFESSPVVSFSSCCRSVPLSTLNAWMSCCRQGWRQPCGGAVARIDVCLRPVRTRRRPAARYSSSRFSLCWAD